MMVTNGWEIERDERGFWAVSGSARIGPYATPDGARGVAVITPMPKKPAKAKDNKVNVS